MLTRYDPERAPDPGRWRAQDEMELLDLVQRYHRREGIRLPDERVHAALHVMVENQALTPVMFNVLLGQGEHRVEAGGGAVLVYGLGGTRSEGENLSTGFEEPYAARRDHVA